jgi:alkanesulfonate monooxygenase SsuD/methylene tetrahydromethanopterin reductase-like flavin-dependent oxidoreductase (luciferase family)
MAQRNALFGYASDSDIHQVPAILRLAQQADRDGLDLFSIADHPYRGQRVDAYAALGFVLGRTRHIAGIADVTNLPTRPAPMLARSVTSLSALSGGRLVLGIGAGGYWDQITQLGVPGLSPGAAVDALAEAITLMRELSGGGPPVTFAGRHYQVTGVDPAPVPTPPIWTGSVGPKSLAVTGTLADGWIPGRASDWRSDLYQTSRPVVDEAARKAGRDPADVATVYNFPGLITAKPRHAVRDSTGRWTGGSVAQWTEELTSAVVEHGAAGFLLFPAGEAAPEVTLGRWAQEIVPAVREAIAKDD